MCAIIVWNGIMPKGLLTQLIKESDTRGRDSTGVAFRGLLDNGKVGTITYRAACSPLEFTQDKRGKAIVGEARKSMVGLAHTRRASPGMPINEINAHPFTYFKTVFAHNGKVDNWQELKVDLTAHYADEVERFALANDAVMTKMAKECHEYVKGITTDSQVLGPYINAGTFEDIRGCMAITWLYENKAYVYRHAKEAVAANIIWRANKPDPAEDDPDHALTIVTSTQEILMTALAKMNATNEITYDFEWLPLLEDRRYRVEPHGLVDEGYIQAGPAIVDEFSSSTVPA